jgi:hypothetical protein
VERALLASPLPVWAGVILPAASPTLRRAGKGQNFPDLIGVVHRLDGATQPVVRALQKRYSSCRQRPSFRHFREAIMNEDVLNVSVRKFLKKVGITSQREIEQAIRTAIAGGRLKGNEALPAKVLLSVEGLGLSVEIEGAVELE